MSLPVGTVRYVVDNTNNISYVEDTYNNSVSIVIDYTQYYANIASKLASIESMLKNDGAHLRMLNGWSGGVSNVSSSVSSVSGANTYSSTSSITTTGL